MRESMSLERDRSSGQLASLRRTRQRRWVDQVVDELDVFAGSQTIYEVLQQRGARVGLSTVYRYLHALAESGQVDSLRTPEGETLYRRCKTHHHHHIVCRVCGRTAEVSLPELERWITDVSSGIGFSSLTHSLEVFGECESCS